MPARRPRGSDAAGRTSPRTSPALARSRGSFFAMIFVFLAIFVEGAHAAASPGCGGLGCCECLCDGASLDPPQYVGFASGVTINSESQCDQANGNRACNELSGDWASTYCHGDTTRMGNRWLSNEICECECLCDEVSVTPPLVLTHSGEQQYWLERCHQGGGLSLAGDCPGEADAGQTCSGTWRLNTKCTVGSPSCTTSQYVKYGVCKTCPSSTSSDPMDPTSPPSSTSAGGDATSCTCPDDFYAATGALPGEWSCMACSGDNFEKTGSAIPTESGNSDTCDCKAGYYLDCADLCCTQCPAGQTSAGGRVTECTSDGSRATGGTVTAVGDYTIHTFTSGGSGTFTVVDADLTEIDVLVVGGGGGGSHSFGGGGGGGEVGYVSSRVVSMQSYSIYVAHGGSAMADTHGEQSSFDDIQAVGGRTAFDTDGRGGSSGIWPGGAGGNAVERVGGGGGGASESGGSGGFSGLSAPGGNGGAGKESDITGDSMYYGGGGGGNSFAAAGGAGGLGGGGSGANMDGGSRLSAPEDGSPNTGGGGGGDGYNAPGNGGSGVVIVRYKKKAASTPSSSSCSSSRATGGTGTTDGDYTIHTFISGGTFAIVDTALTGVDVLVVGGGGAGHMTQGGGGGGGQVVISTFPVSATSYSVVVGDGGKRGSDGTPDSPNGGLTSFGTLVAEGGNAPYSSDGGSSGGSVHDGGMDHMTMDYGGGGGGAGGAGGDSVKDRPNGADGAGDGGVGLQSDISGTMQYYGGGGGGGGKASESSPGQWWPWGRR